MVVTSLIAGTAPATQPRCDSARTTWPQPPTCRYVPVGIVLPTKESRAGSKTCVFQKAGYDALFSQGDSAKEKRMLRR